MVNHQITSDNKGDSDKHSNDHRTPPPLDKGKEGPKSDTPAAGKQEYATQKEVAEGPKLYLGQPLFNWLSLFFSLWLVVFTGLLMYYSSKQWEVTREMAQASRIGADAAQRAANAAQTSANAANRSAAAAEETAKVSKQSLVLQRPYLAVKSIELRDFTAGKKPVAVVSFENVGKTPALNTTVHIVISFLDTPLPQEPPYPPLKTPPSVFVLFPGISWWSSVTTEREARADEVDSVNQGRMWLYVYGTARYKYILGKEAHTTTFCAFYRASEPSGFAACPYHNRMD